MTLIPLDNPVRPYAWGSRTVLAELFGRPPAREPEAELWIGAHPTAPSMASGTERSLKEIIDADPATTLGPHGTRLPFLLKVLAVEQPLSLQVHPDERQAREGFARESAEGVPADDPLRSYHDDQPKPELICALTPFAALCGFAPPAASAELLTDLDVPKLHPVTDALEAGDLEAAATTLLTWPEPDRPAVVGAVAAACAERPGPRHAWTRRLAERYPGDMGVVTAMLLELLVLQPGEAMYVAPGTPHAYLRGTGVEIMAASDNVLRGGLTPKHIDLPELLRVTRFEPVRPHPGRPVALPSGEQAYDSPSDRFRLTRCPVADPVRVEDPGPSAVLCLDGEIVAERDGTEVRLAPGGAIFVPYAGGPLTLTGRGTAFRAAPGAR